ncbi:uncharacterized protein LOC144995549 [Oryzias latipes]
MAGQNPGGGGEGGTAHVTSEGGDITNPTLVLSRWKIQFGKYQDKTFHWLLENDVGNAVNLVSSHQKEPERTSVPTDGQQGDESEHILALWRFRFHQAFEEERVRSLQPGQEGQALVGFGDFKFETLQTLYESEDPKKIWFVNYLQRKAPAPGTQMENAVRFIKPNLHRDLPFVPDAPPPSPDCGISAGPSGQPDTVLPLAGLEEQPVPAVLPPPPSAGNAELLPESWRAALTVEQQQWIGRVLFTRDSSGRSKLITELNLWWNPPQPRPIYHQPPASPDLFFTCRLFLWMPHKIWGLQLTCPKPLCGGSLTKAELYRTIRRVLDIDGWYLMATEYLECRWCKKKVGGVVTGDHKAAGSHPQLPVSRCSRVQAVL